MYKHRALMLSTSGTVIVFLFYSPMNYSYIYDVRPFLHKQTAETTSIFHRIMILQLLFN